MNFRLATGKLDDRVLRFPFFYGWIILGVAGLAHFSSGPGQTYVASVFIGPMIDELGWSRTLISTVYTAGSLTAAFLMVFAGRLFDRFGARTMLTVVALLLGLATLWMSRVNSPLELYIGFAALRTLGQGTLGLVSASMVAMWFIRLRGRATAIASLGQAVSQAVFPILVFALITQFGWRSAWVGLGLIVWVVLLIPSFVFARRSPESVGLLPDGDAVTPQTSAQSEARIDTDFTLGEALRTSTMWLLVIVGMGLPLIMTGLMFHHISFMESKGVESGLAAAVLGLFGPMMLAGNIAGGLLSDKLPNKYILAGGQVLLVLTMLWAMTISTSWQAFAYIVMAGVSAGVSNTTYTVVWPNYFGRAHVGSIRGVTSAIVVGFSAMGALPFGFIFDATGSYDRAIQILLVLPIAGGVAALVMQRPRKGA